MLNGQYVSCSDIIREVFRDNRYTYELPWQDAIEWCAEAIRLIGAPMALSPRQAIVHISNYRGMLPCDVDTVMQVAGSFDGCTPFPMTTSTNTFHPVKFCDEVINPELIGEANIEGFNTEPIGQDIAGNPVFTFQNGSTSFPGEVTDVSNRTASSVATYNINDNFVFTNFKDGCVFIAYKALPVDKDGFPLIPDNERYKKGVKSYITERIDYILWRGQEISENVYRNSEREWLWYVGSAGNAARMPGYDGMQAIMNQIKLIPRRYAHDQFFLKLGSK